MTDNDKLHDLIDECDSALVRAIAAIEENTRKLQEYFAAVDRGELGL